MGFYFRKSINLGICKLNFSKSGISVSFGIKGFRFTLGPKGLQFNAGRKGLYYNKSVSKKKLKKAVKTSVDIAKKLHP
jgi:hypothetical protein